MQEVPQTVAMAFSGGLGLAAYHAGVYEAFARQALPLHWVTGASAGAVTAALIAGSSEDRRLESLKSFWQYPPMDRRDTKPWRHAFGWMTAIETRLTGSSGFFRLRIPDFDPFRFRSFYDLAPMRDRLIKLIDFGRLNSGQPRLSIAATDLESGEPAIFDSHSTRLEIDHLLASCGFLPEFAPVEIGDRLLGDGGLSLNTPFDPVLEDLTTGDLLLYVADLYARDGERPYSLEAAAERKNDLMMANQTCIRLAYLAREDVAEGTGTKAGSRQRPDIPAQLPTGHGGARPGEIIRTVSLGFWAALESGKAGYGVRTNSVIRGRHYNRQKTQSLGSNG